jgi:hypothetical protein
MIIASENIPASCRREMKTGIELSRMLPAVIESLSQGIPARVDYCLFPEFKGSLNELITASLIFAPLQAGFKAYASS